MADSLLLRAMRPGARTVKLSGRGLRAVPRLVGQLAPRLAALDLKHNLLEDLPREFALLVHLETLNLGCNSLEALPGALQHCVSLRVLHLFTNSLRTLTPSVLESLYSLTLLNLNNNQLQTLPPEIGRLAQLQCLSLDGNQLESLPPELCALGHLQELHVADNLLTSLPPALGALHSLRKLHAHKNYIRQLPESISACSSLSVLDVAANDIRVFPTQFTSLRLREFYCEQNPLLRPEPVHCRLDELVLPLKELCARLLLSQLTAAAAADAADAADCSSVRAVSALCAACSVPRGPATLPPAHQQLLVQAGHCAHCHTPFLHAWLECVTFTSVRSVLRAPARSSPRGGAPKSPREVPAVSYPAKGAVLPLRALLCSPRCFNTPPHKFYRIAFT